MSREMPVLDHLEELRWRMIWSLVALAVATAAAFWILLDVNVIGWLERPILPLLGGRRLVFTHPGDPFQIVLQASISLGVLLALPILLYQVWSFMAPALYRHERRIAAGAVTGAVLLFVCGVSLGWFVVLPLALPWLLSFGTQALDPMITAAEYFSFSFSLVLAFGVAFELPVVLVGLTTLGLVTPQRLSSFRRHAILAAVIIGAFLTPGDLVWTTVAMAVPLYILYELSIMLSYPIYHRRLRGHAGSSMALEELGRAG